MSQPITLDKQAVVDCLIQASSSLIQAAMLLRTGGYPNESIDVSELSIQVSKRLGLVRENLLDGKSDR